jgi:hypothetical protein
MMSEVIERYVFDGRVEHRHPIFREPCCHENVRALGADPDEDNSLLDLLGYHRDRRVRVTVEFLTEDPDRPAPERRATDAAD